MPSARSKAFFASFLWPPGQKGWRLAGRDQPVLLGSKKNREQQINDLLLSGDKRISKKHNSRHTKKQTPHTNQSEVCQ
jgi:hypothetical protein